MGRFSPEELRRAIVALEIIEDQGDQDEWAYIRAEATKNAAPGDRPWHYATANQSIGGRMLGDRLADLLGESRDRCAMAAAEVFAKQRHRAVYDALLAYAAELTGQSSPRPSSAAPTAPQRPAVRIVSNQDGAA